jgi:hypothetical protein
MDDSPCTHNGVRSVSHWTELLCGAARPHVCVTGLGSKSMAVLESEILGSVHSLLPPTSKQTSNVLATSFPSQLQLKPALSGLISI